uniref:Uncharacterized protein n=1 Tax=Arundo donax TaxID=35708 RepID=A0A0A9A2R3_ARUDO
MRPLEQHSSINCDLFVLVVNVFISYFNSKFMKVFAFT